MYAPQPQAVAPPFVVRLIGVLDGDLVAAFTALERSLAGGHGTTVLVDVRDLDVLGESAMNELAGVVAGARRAGRDVRLDARSLRWKRVVKKNLSAQPPVDAQLRSGIRRTVILARSANSRHR